MRDNKNKMKTKNEVCTMTKRNYVHKQNVVCFILTFLSFSAFQTNFVNALLKSMTKLSALRQRELDYPFLSALQATMRFEGAASSDVLIKFPDGDNNSILDWLHSPDSDGALLGSEFYTLRQDGFWDCYQPPVDWFGLQLKPIFVHKIDRSNIKSHNNVSIIIVDARTEISNPDSSIGGIQQIMEKSSFEGFNILTIQRNKRSWTLSSDVSLTLSVPLPPFVPLPLGFNTVGSNIVSRTCQERARENLLSVKESYLQWTYRVASNS